MNKKGQLSESTPCVSCGYELVGLGPEGVCPECGVDIRRSLNPGLLASQPIGVLWRVQVGAMLLAGAIGLGPFLCLSWLMGGGLAQRWFWWTISACWVGVFAVGVWLIAVRWSAFGARAGTDDGMWSTALRIFVLFIPTSSVAAFLVAILVPVFSAMFLLMMFGVVLFVILVVIFTHVEFLASRIPSKNIQSLVTIARFMSGVGALLVVCGVIFPPIAVLGLLLAVPGLVVGAVAMGELAVTVAGLRRMRE